MGVYRRECQACGTNMTIDDSTGAMSIITRQEMTMRHNSLYCKDCARWQRDAALGQLPEQLAAAKKAQGAQ